MISESGFKLYLDSIMPILFTDLRLKGGIRPCSISKTEDIGG